MKNHPRNDVLGKIGRVKSWFSKRPDQWPILIFFMKLLGNISIRRRLILFFLSLCIGPIILIGAVSYVASKNAITGKAAKYAVESLIQTTVNLQLKLKKYEDLSMQLQINSEYNQAMKEFAATGSRAAGNQLQEAIKNTLALDEDVRSILVGSLRNDACVGGGFEEPGGLFPKFKKTAVFKAALQNKGQAVWGTFDQDIALVRVINDFGTGEQMAVYAVIFQGYKINKLVNPSLYEGNSASLKDRPYTMIVKVDGLVLASPNQDNVGQNISTFVHNREIGAVLRKNEAQNGEFSDRIQNQDVLITYNRIGDHNWYFLMVSPNSYLYAEIRGVGFFTLVIAILISFSAVLVSLVVALSISYPLEQVKEAMQRAEGGNLAAKVTTATNDELAELSNSFNRMTGRIGALIRNTQEAVGAVSDHSQALETNSDQSAQSAAAVAAAAGEISRGTMEQTAEAEQTARQMGELAQEIETAVAQAGEVAKITEATRSSSIAAQEIVARLIQKAQETDEITASITRDIDELSASAGEIRSLTEVITNIAEQTNLLGLNASIEAARAGDQGLGFAVVAAEVNKLAAQSQEAATMINHILQGIQGKTAASAQTAAQAHRIVTEQLAAVRSTQGAFDQIIAAMGNVVQRIADVNERIQQINAVKNKTMTAIMNISSISEESAASSQEVSAAIQEQTVVIDQVKQMANQLNGMADKLVAAIAQFQV